MPGSPTPLLRIRNWAGEFPISDQHARKISDTIENFKLLRLMFCFAVTVAT